MIPVSKPCLQKDDIEATVNAVKSGWISSIGSELRDFEREFAAFIGAQFCLSCSNGTTALQLAFSSIGICHGDEVIIPNLTFAAVANSVIAVGAKPVCVDVDIHTWNICIEKISSAITKNTKAVVIVHSYGNPVDVLKIKNRFPNLFIIEDCAEAHGSQISEKRVGSFGDISTFSFYANKIITTGEGGCVLTNDKDIHARLMVLRDHGMDPKVRFSHLMPGFNYRMTNIQGAIGRTQLRKIDEFIIERRLQEQFYDDSLLALGLTKPIKDSNSETVNWLYTRMLPVGIDRDALILHLKLKKIETRPIFRPINSFTYMKSNEQKLNEFDNSTIISKRGISLPTYNGLHQSQQEIVISAIQEFLLA